MMSSRYTASEGLSSGKKPSVFMLEIILWEFPVTDLWLTFHKKKITWMRSITNMYLLTLLCMHSQQPSASDINKAEKLPIRWVAFIEYE